MSNPLFTLLASLDRDVQALDTTARLLADTRECRSETLSVLSATLAGTPASSYVDALADASDASLMLSSARFVPFRDALDSFCEQTDTALDEKRGLLASPRSAQVSTVVIPRAAQRGKAVRVVHAQIPRPQAAFVDPVDNGFARLFCPSLPDKPNAIAPLDDVFANPPADAPPDWQFPHPYATEIEQLTYPDWQLQRRKEQLYPPVGAIPFVWVASLSALESMCAALAQEQMIAVDLEHHSFRSFQGFLCLMQVSTRSCDYLVDLIALRCPPYGPRVVQQHLQPIFTDPRICKVMHGADHDVLWLQRDFSIYVVNLFDTGQASRVLQMAKHSLQFLLKHYCGIAADKQYQLADWRLRPLTDEMARYAREDTHYLLYVADRMSNELLQHRMLNVALRQSQDVCLTTYIKPAFDETSYLTVYNSANVVLDETQLRVFQALYAWRDRTARELDESTGFVMPNRYLVHLASHVPVTTQQLLQTGNPTITVRQLATDVMAVINSAREGRGGHELGNARPTGNMQRILQMAAAAPSLDTDLF